MRTYRTLIVDKDYSALQELADILQERSEIDLIGECDNGSEALQIIATQQPDLVFLEIELPEVNGFEILKNIGKDQIPLVIFTSSCKDFALQAFEVEALDYIQKPFNVERIGKSLDRIKKLTSNGIENIQREDIGKLVRDFKKPNNLERFIIKQSGEYYLIRTEDVIWIEADGNYSRIITQDKKFMVRYTLSGFDDQLNSDQFYRISRSQIVNIDYVVKIKEHLYGNYIIELKNGSSLKMSKNYKQLLEALKNF